MIVIHHRSLRSLTFICAFSLLSSCQIFPDTWADAFSGASRGMTPDGNSLYHQSDEVSLQTAELEIAGEVKNPGRAKLRNYYKREVFIREAAFDPDTGIDFIGAYRYRGYSLFDLLHPYNQQKKNAETFRPAIDLYIVIENDLGETVVFSWSEIFHTINPHQVLIATEVAPILPYRNEVEYPVGEKWKVVSAGDLFAWRTLENPVKITVYSFDKKDYRIIRDLEPMYSPQIDVVMEGREPIAIKPEEIQAASQRYISSFYGMGMGYHAVKHFEGPGLDDVIGDKIDITDPGLNRNGLICFAGLDGYRAIFSFSELFNRTDQVSPVLAIPENLTDGGYYRIFHPSDFYADRSVKSLSEIFIFQE